MNEQIHKIAEHYGFASQSIMLIEEMAELTKSITKFRRVIEGYQPPSKPISADKAMESVVEEMADVEIMLEQLKHLLHIPDEMITTVKFVKVKRTLDIIEQEG